MYEESASRRRVENIIRQRYFDLPKTKKAGQALFAGSLNHENNRGRRGRSRGCHARGRRGGARGGSRRGSDGTTGSDGVSNHNNKLFKVVQETSLATGNHACLHAGVDIRTSSSIRRTVRWSAQRSYGGGHRPWSLTQNQRSQLSKNRRFSKPNGGAPPADAIFRR